jgi:hypothetical protein
MPTTLPGRAAYEPERFVDEALRQNWDRCLRARRFTSSSMIGQERRSGLFLDIFSGAGSPLTLAYRLEHWAALPVDCLIGGAHHDLTSAAVVDSLVRLVLSGAVACVHLAPPC